MGFADALNRLNAPIINANVVNQAQANGGLRDVPGMPGYVFAPTGYQGGNIIPKSALGGISGMGGGGVGGIGGGGIGGGGGNLTDSYQKSYDEAKKANEARYSEILQGYRNRQQQATKLIAGMGNTEYARINREYADMGGQATQSAIGRGLGNTTVLDSLQRGVQADRQTALNAAQEGVRRNLLNITTGLSGDTLQFMERRNDTYPDINQLIALSKGVGQAGGGGGGFGGGVGNPAPTFLPPGQTSGYIGGNMAPVLMDSGARSRGYLNNPATNPNLGINPFMYGIG